MLGRRHSHGSRCSSGVGGGDGVGVAGGGGIRRKRGGFGGRRGAGLKVR